MAGTDEEIVSILTQILIMFAIALASTLIGKPLRCPPLLMYLILGCLFGNLGILDPENKSLEFFAQFSITLLFYALGFEDSVEHFIEGLKLTWSITIINDSILFGAGMLAAYLIWPERGWTLHVTIATAVVAKPVSLTMLLLQNLGFLKKRAAIAIMSTAVVDDIGCLILIAVLLPIIVVASPNTALPTATYTYDNVSAHFGINSSGFASVDSSVQSQVDAAKLVIASDLSNVLNMSTSGSIVFSTAVFAANYAEIIFYNLAPFVSQDDFEKANFNLSISDVSSSQQSKNWLQLTNRLYGTISDYTLYSQSHDLVDVTTTLPAPEQAGLDGGAVGIILAKVIGFFAILYVLHNVILPDHITEEDSWLVSKIPGIRHYGIRHLLSFSAGSQVPLIVIVYGFCGALIAIALGLPPIIGSWFFGLLLEHRYFDVIEYHYDDERKSECEELGHHHGDDDEGLEETESNSNEEEMKSQKQQQKSSSSPSDSKKNKKNSSTSEGEVPFSSPVTRKNVSKNEIMAEDDQEQNRDNLLDNFLNEEVEFDKEKIREEIEDGEYDRIMKERNNKVIVAPEQTTTTAGADKNNKNNNTNSVVLIETNRSATVYPKTPTENEEEEEEEEEDNDNSGDPSRGKQHQLSAGDDPSSRKGDHDIDHEDCNVNTFERARDAVATAAFMWLGPVFFIHLGSTFIFKPEFLATAVPQGLIIFAFLYVSQLASSTLAARYAGGFRWAESGLVGAGMLGRAELFFTVMSAAKSAGVVDNEVFVPMSIAALLMNVSLTVTLTLYAPIYTKYEYWEPGEDEEEEEIEEGQKDDDDKKSYRSVASSRIPDYEKDDDNMSTIISRRQRAGTLSSQHHNRAASVISGRSNLSRLSKTSRASRISAIVRRGVGMHGFVDNREGSLAQLPVDHRDADRGGSTVNRRNSSVLRVRNDLDRSVNLMNMFRSDTSASGASPTHTINNMDATTVTSGGASPSIAGSGGGTAHRQNSRRSFVSGGGGDKDNNNNSMSRNNTQEANALVADASRDTFAGTISRRMARAQQKRQDSTSLNNTAGTATTTGGGGLNNSATGGADSLAKLDKHFGHSKQQQKQQQQQKKDDDDDDDDKKPNNESHEPTN